MVAVAVNVTEPPLHIEVLPDVIVTDGVTDVAVIVIELLVAMVGFAQGSLLVMTTETLSPLFNAELINAEPICPATGIPFIIH